ncbi:MAG TPA: hypothetical protein VF658_18980 [Pyrinomonadaceae bacterium]
MSIIKSRRLGPPARRRDGRDPPCAIEAVHQRVYKFLRPVYNCEGCTVRREP